VIECGPGARLKAVVSDMEVWLLLLFLFNMTGCAGAAILEGGASCESDCLRRRSCGKA
jgi:hypothetical protein